MATGPCHLAGLSAVSRTRPCMAGTLAGVLTAGHASTTRFPTGNTLYVASQILPLFVSPVAGLDGEGGAGRALLLTVAVVGDGMVAIVGPTADSGTFGWSDPTGHRRIDHSCTTATGKLVKTDIGTLGAFSAVARFLASVESTGEQLAAGERARVLQQDATVFAALVSSTTSLRLALFSTSRVISPCGQLNAWHLLVHMPTPTLDKGSQRARGTGACVAGEWASVRSRGCATGQRFLASLAANWDGIKAV